MKFAVALIALATAAFAAPTAPTTSALEVRGGYGGGDCESCHEHDGYGHDHDGYGHRSGYGRHHGRKERCDNWVPCDKDGIVLDIEAEVCLNVNVLGLLKVDLKVDLDVEIDIGLIKKHYPSCERLYCDPHHSCEKGKKVHEDKCWEHEFDEEKWHHGNY
ncbi:hypothetical protein QQS21_004181 [Conoideocrella luteorostrata]|uniref:Uncharacterized protein n=1 Tax=Conoideocrella luteorostrata TaxID=1105319 RepID=A0AAJ0CSR9_9HYPO|nr:hypothetical protein QQS21_004181 [Conoideocrella luteorostrata]